MISPAVPVAALLPLLAAVCVLFASGAVKNFFRPPAPTSVRKVDMFLTRMAHETCNGTRFVSFRIDCFLFDFKPWNPDGLEEKAQYGFFDYARTLDLANQQAIVKLMLWLTQHGVRYDLRYQWNRDLPFTYNLKQIPKPRKLKRLVMSIGYDAIMAYDLSKDTHALHP